MFVGVYLCVPVSGGTGRCSNGCRREWRPEERVNSQAFHKSFSQARLKKYRESLQLPIIDKVRPVEKRCFPMKAEMAFPAPKKDFDDILEVFAKATENIDRLT